jgi:hypothetical protein
MAQAAKFAVFALIGFLAWQLAGRLYLGQVYNTVTARAQRGNDLDLYQPHDPDFEHVMRGIDTRIDLSPGGSPRFDDSDRRNAPLRRR